MTITTFVADYANPEHAEGIVAMLDLYARDPMGGGAPLPAPVRARLVAGLAGVPGAVSVLCRVDDRPAGLLNAFPGFSTFAARPILNVHDLIVAPACRGAGIGRLLLERAEAIARARGCCKLTLEVLEGNATAQALYRTLGYEGYSLDPAMGRALFWQKPLG